MVRKRASKEVVILNEVSDRLRSKKNTTQYLTLLEKSNSLVGKLITLAIFLDFNNQIAAQNEILNLFKSPLYIWNNHLLIITQENEKQVEDNTNFIILYILSHLAKDEWRKRFWAFLQNYTLDNLKLNEVRDFKINDVDVLKQVSKKSLFGVSFLVGWVRIYEALEEKDELINYLKSIQVGLINPSNVEALLPYYQNLTQNQQNRVYAIIESIKDKNFTTINNQHLEQIENERKK